MFWETCPVFAALAYACIVLSVLLWSFAPIQQIGEQRQGLYHEDLQQMHWERCVLTALPRQGLLLFLVGLPLLVVFEHYLSNGAIAALIGDGNVAVVVTWAVRTIFGLVFIVASLALLGGLYFSIWRKADHERRYQRFKDETIIMNAAYLDKHRQLNMLRPAPGTKATRQKAKKRWVGLG